MVIIQLLDCLKSCPEIFDQTAPDDQIRIEAQTQNFNGNKDRRNNISNKNETLQSHNDMDQDDYDAILELQALHRHGRLEESSYSQFHVERLREQINIKKKQLHKKLWTVKQKEKLRKKQQRVKGSDRMFLQVDRNTGSFTTVIDPSAYHEVECEMACHKSFACGTETAPIS
ncbi:hypothetical protein FBU30_010872 [Linnemannia zychae]|nr:hypothetical protein FBU30_010872 [Linnemannia zychae]